MEMNNRIFEKILQNCVIWIILSITVFILGLFSINIIIIGTVIFILLGTCFKLVKVVSSKSKFIALVLARFVKDTMLVYPAYAFSIVLVGIFSLPSNDVTNNLFGSASYNSLLFTIILLVLIIFASNLHLIFWSIMKNKSIYSLFYKKEPFGQFLTKCNPNKPKSLINLKRKTYEFGLFGGLILSIILLFLTNFFGNLFMLIKIPNPFLILAWISLIFFTISLLKLAIVDLDKWTQG